MYRKFDVQKFPHMSKVTPFRKVKDSQRPVGERTKYYVLKSDPEGGKQIGEEDVAKTLRYGKSVLRNEGMETSKIDGVETVLGAGKVIPKREREFTIHTFLKREKVPVIYFSANSWIIEPMTGCEELYVCLNNMMLEKNVVGIANFVLIKSYNVRNVIVVPTEKGLIAQEIPWGNNFVADGLSVDSQYDEEQLAWMEKWLNELPNREEEGYGKNPLLERVWTNIQLRGQGLQLDYTLPVEERPSFGEDLKEEALNLFNWRNGLELEDEGQL